MRRAAESRPSHFQVDDDLVHHMEHNLTGKTILIIEGSLLAGAELRDAFGRAGARVYLTGNVINAFSLLERIRFDGAVIDQGLHNAAFELYSELQDLGIPCICCTAPHRLQKAAARKRDADHVVWRLINAMSAAVALTPELPGDLTDDLVSPNISSEDSESIGLVGGLTTLARPEHRNDTARHP